jgi:hypothetical protein
MSLLAGNLVRLPQLSSAMGVCLMKPLVIFVALLSLCAGAAAKPNPIERDEDLPSFAEAAVIQPEVLRLETTNFRAPKATQAKDKNFSCGLQLLFSPKPIRLARWCP